MCEPRPPQRPLPVEIPAKLDRTIFSAECRIASQRGSPNSLPVGHTPFTRCSSCSGSCCCCGFGRVGSKTAFCSGLELPCRHRGCGCRGAALLQVAAAPRNPLPCTNPRYGGYPPQLCNPILKIIVACSRFVGGAGLRRAACSLRPRATAPARDATEFETRALPQAPPKAQKPPPQGVSSLACENLFVTPTIVCVRRFRSAIPRMPNGISASTRQQWPRGRRSSLWWRGLHRVVCSASDSRLCHAQFVLVPWYVVTSTTRS